MDVRSGGRHRSKPLNLIALNVLLCGNRIRRAMWLFVGVAQAVALRLFKITKLQKSEFEGGSCPA